MIQIIAQHTVRFFFLVILQVLILNNIQMGGYINPYFYILFILLLPFELPAWFGLLLAFGLGLFVDIFSSTLGMHIAATLFMAYCRPFILKVLSPRDGYEFGLKPTLQDMGFAWFASYAGILIFLHHLFLFFTEVFRFTEFFSTLSRVILSAILTFILVIISQLLGSGNKRN